MAAKKKAKKQPVPTTPEAVRKRVLADPNTAKIAKNLGVSLEKYVEQVVHFVLNPKAEPSLYVADDEDLKAMGAPPPDAEAMGRYIVEAVKVNQAAGATDYEAKKQSLPGVSDLPQVGHEHTDAKLKKELDRQLKAKRSGKG